MKYFFDTEFYDDGKDLEFISLGIVSEDNRCFYAQNSAIDYRGIKDEWLRKNVINKLWIEFKSIDVIRSDLVRFVGMDRDAEFWGYNVSYDFFLLCRIFGKMSDLPENFGHTGYDVKCLGKYMGKSDIVKGISEDWKKCSMVHHSLFDALWTKDIYDRLVIG